MRPSSTSSFEFRGERALKAMGWAVVLYFAVDLTCRAFLPEGSLLRVEDLTRERMATAPAPDIEILGDSVARSGFFPSALSDGHVTARNDALQASGPIFSYHLFKDQIDAGRAPKALVLTHSPHTLGQVRIGVLLGGFAEWSEIPRLAWDYGDWDDAVYGVLTRISYLLMHRDSFQDLFQKRDASFFRKPDSAARLFSDRDELKLFRKQLAAGTYSVNHLKARAPAYYLTPFQPLPINDLYLRRLLKLAREHGVKVYWFTMPTPRVVKEARETVGYEGALLAYLQQFERRGDLKILRANFVVYDDLLFRDWLHLNVAGAVKLACETRELKPLIVGEFPTVAAADMRNASFISPSPPPTDDARAVIDEYCHRDIVALVHAAAGKR